MPLLSLTRVRSPNTFCTLRKHGIDILNSYDLENPIKLQTVEIRKEHNIKLPDSIIAATALVFNMELITRNEKDFQNIVELKIVNPFENRPRSALKTTRMKNLFPLLFLGFAACNQPTTETPSEPTEAMVWTKTMEYAVDLNSVFHLDLNDEDFSDVSPLTEQLIAHVVTGKLKAYDRFSDEILTVEQVKSILQFTDTLWFEEPETGDRHIEIVKRDYTVDFYGLTFREKWSYDKSGAIINRKIIGLAPRIPVYSSQGGELRGYTSAFWVRYE